MSDLAQHLFDEGGGVWIVLDEDDPPGHAVGLS